MRRVVEFVNEIVQTCRVRRAGAVRCARGAAGSKRLLRLGDVLVDLLSNGSELVGDFGSEGGDGGQGGVDAVEEAGFEARSRRRRAG